MFRLLRLTLMMVLALMISGLSSWACACVSAASLPSAHSHTSIRHHGMDAAMACHEDEGACAPHSKACAHCDSVMGPGPGSGEVFTAMSAPSVKSQAVKALGIIPAANALLLDLKISPRPPDERRSALTPVSPVRLYTRLLN